MKPYFKIIPFIVFLTFFGCEDNRYKKVISTDKAPQAIGPYSQAIQNGNKIYLSGQIAIDPETDEIIANDISLQTKQVMENIKKILISADFEMRDIVQVQIYLSDLNNYKTMNEVYSTYFNNEPPARAVVEANKIPKDALIEVLVVAEK